MKNTTSAFVIAVLLAHPFSAAAAKTKSDLVVSPFAGKEANVNAYVFSDARGSLIVDATRKSEDAKSLADFARSKGVPVKTIFITHGHPDHFVGLPVLKKEFPDAKFLVASERVKDDIINMASMKWMSSEPAAQPKSEANPNGFDYKNEIGVLDSSVLKMPGGGSLEVISDFPATEAAHETALFSKELNAVFPSDLVYNKVHLWLAGGVDAAGIKNWRAALDRLKRLYGPLHAKVYPGHGRPADTSVFDADEKYMDDLLAIVKSAKTEDDAKKSMMKMYPDWENADFILVQSIRNQTKLLGSR